MIRLEHADLGALALEHANGIHVESFDAPLPLPRANVSDRTAMNGTDDYTRLFGARTLAMTLHVEHTPARPRQATLDLLRAYCSPRRRSWLYVDLDDSGDERRIKVRGSDLGAPITVPGYAAVQLSLIAPEGVFEDADETLAVVSSSTVVSTIAGRSYPKTYPVVYRKTPATGVGRVVNLGSEPASAVLRLYGPCTDPYVLNVDTGDEITFTGGLRLSATQFVEIDTAAYTATFNGRDTQSVLGNLDLLRTTFGSLVPGRNRFRYKPKEYDRRAFMQVRFRSTWL